MRDALRTLIVGLCLCAGSALASDQAADEPVAEDVVADVVDERAEQDDSAEEAKPADADVGEASYNTANCAEPEQGDGDSGQEKVADAGDAVDAVDMDVECEQVIK